MFDGEYYKIKLINPDDIKPNDIVVAFINDSYVVKRVTAVYKCAVDLKGDNIKQSMNFKYVSKKRIKFKVVRPTLTTKLMRRYLNAKK